MCRSFACASLLRSTVPAWTRWNVAQMVTVPSDGQFRTRGTSPLEPHTAAKVLCAQVRACEEGAACVSSKKVLLVRVRRRCCLCACEEGAACARAKKFLLVRVRGRCCLCACEKGAACASVRSARALAMIIGMESSWNLSLRSGVGLGFAIWGLVGVQRCSKEVDVEVKQLRRGETTLDAAWIGCDLSNTLACFSIAPSG
jgi:hypothetical protein